MGEIFYKLRINGNDRTSVVNAFLDTGSTHNVIRYDLPDGKLTLDLAIFYDEHGAKDMEVIGNKEPQTLGTTLGQKSSLLIFLYDQEYFLSKEFLRAVHFGP